MRDEEVVALAKQAFQFGQEMRAAIADNDNEERKAVRTEWEIFRGENSEYHSSLLAAYRNGLDGAETRV